MQPNSRRMCCTQASGKLPVPQMANRGGSKSALVSIVSHVKMFSFTPEINVFTA